MRLEKMKPIFKTLLNLSIWILFVKGLLLIPVTFYTFGLAFLCGELSPIVGIASCAAGTFAFAMACVAIWIRDHMQDAH
jgi:hypothetical protein